MGPAAGGGAGAGGAVRRGGRRGGGWRGWLGEAQRLVERWFTLEDPTRLEPAERELFVETELESGLQLRGFIDRVDVAPTGEVRIVDYKTGKAPRAGVRGGALFQMKFYALVLWRLRGVVPRRLQLVYLGSGDVLTYDPDEADLGRRERKLLALWEAIRRATETGDWRPRPSGCAAGATTRRCARSSAALPRRCRWRGAGSGPPPSWWRSRRVRRGSAMICSGVVL